MNNKIPTINIKFFPFNLTLKTLISRDPHGNVRELMNLYQRETDRAVLMVKWPVMCVMKHQFCM